MHKNVPHVALFMRDLAGGGGERVMLNLACGLAKQGLKVDLLLTRAEGAYLNQVPPEVRLIDFKANQLDRGKTFRFPTSFQSIGSLPKLIRYLQTEKPAALLAAMHFTNEIAVLAKHLAFVPTKVVVSEHILLSLDAARLNKIYSRPTVVTSRLFYPWANNIVAVSHGVAEDLAKITDLPLKRIRVIYNPAIAPELRAKMNQPINHPWFAPGEPPVILGIGRLVEQKDFPSLIHALTIVRQTRPARLMILGEGKERSRLESLVRELGLEQDVALPGFVENPYAYLKQSAVFVLSSAWEGLPTVLIEAMAVGTPVVSTNCESGPAEILQQGKYGHLVSVGNREAIADGILKVLSGDFPTVDPDWIEQFTLETSTRNYLDVLEISVS